MSKVSSLTPAIIFPLLDHFQGEPDQAAIMSEPNFHLWIMSKVSLQPHHEQIFTIDSGHVQGNELAYKRQQLHACHIQTCVQGDLKRRM
jgi:hypothetical protein